MSKNNKRDAWTYLIVALLMANLFVINNYITNKAIVIIEAKNNTSNHKTFNIETLKQGVTSKYISIINSTKEVLGMEVAKANASEQNSTKTNATNTSVRSKVIGAVNQPIDNKQIHGIVPIISHKVKKKLEPGLVHNINKNKVNLKGASL